MNPELMSNSQHRLYGFNMLLRDIIKMYNLGIMPNKILFSGPKGIGKATTAYHLINYILSRNEDNKYDLDTLTINQLNKSFTLVKNNVHPNFHLIDVINDNKTIEISQIREMINYSNKSSFNNKEKIVLIDNVENLNLSSLNALLKIVEEPNNNIIFILIFDSNREILDTLKSRCLKFNFFLSSKESINVANQILNKKVLDLINEDLLNYYIAPGDLVKLIDFSNKENFNLKQKNLKFFLNYLIDNNYYKKDLFIKKNIFKFIELYFYKLIQLTNNKRFNFSYDKFINKISNVKKYNLDVESLFIEIKAKLLNE